MATNYPTGIDSNPGDPTPSETLLAGGHANLHTFVQDAMIAVQTYLGVTASAVATTITYLLTNTSSIDPGHKHSVTSGGTGFYGVVAKGVILIGNAVNWTKLAVGADGTVLTADSSQTSGVKWGGSPVPTGSMFPYAAASAPSGFLLCDGSAVSRTTNATLFGIIGTTYGAGDGSTTFNLPDTRGRTMIGTGTGTKVATIASATTSVLTVTGITNAANNEFQTGQAVVFTATVAGNLVTATTYFVVRTGNLAFSVASSLANAQNASIITLAGTERGTFTLTLAARTIGDTGGEENHAMSATELIAHSHTYAAAFNGANSGQLPGPGTPGTSNAQTRSTDNTGGTAGMNVMQPFFTGTYIIKT